MGIFLFAVLAFNFRQPFFFNFSNVNFKVWTYDWLRQNISVNQMTNPEFLTVRRDLRVVFVHNPCNLTPAFFLCYFHWYCNICCVVLQLCVHFNSYSILTCFFIKKILVHLYFFCSYLLSRL